MGQSHKQKQIMPTIQDFTSDFINACRIGDSAVKQLLRDKPEFLNQKDSRLMWATLYNRTETVKLLLSKPDVDLSLQNYWGETAITEASCYNSVDCLKLLLLHPKCTKEIVEMKNNDGQTAEMIAKSKGHQECEQLLKSFKTPINSIIEKHQINTQNKSFSVLMNSKPASDLSLEEMFSEVKSLTSVQQEKESIIRKHKEKEKKEVEEFDQKLQMIEVEHEKELQKIDTEHEKESRKMDAEHEKELQRIEKKHKEQKARHEKQYGDRKTKYEKEFKDKKAKHNEALQSKQTLYAQERDVIECLFSKGELRNQELQDVLQGRFGMMISSQSQASIPTSAVPDCYSCLEKYRPRIKLWACRSGHSVCGNCYDRMPNKRCGQCREPITGRATDMEKIIMSLYNLN